MADFKIKDFVKNQYDIKHYKEETWTGTLDDYVNMVLENPLICRG